LAHGRNHDAIGQFQGALGGGQFIFSKKQAHVDLPLMMEAKGRRQKKF
jgi:hypothetical protein